MEKKDAVYSIVSLFIWVVMLPSIHLSIHPKTMCKECDTSLAVCIRGWYPENGDLVVVKCPQQYKKMQFDPAHSFQLVLLPDGCVSWWGTMSVPLCMLFHVWVSRHLLSLDPTPSQHLYLQSLKGHRMTKSHISESPISLCLPGRKTQAFWLGFYCSGHLWCASANTHLGCSQPANQLTVVFDLLA